MFEKFAYRVRHHRALARNERFWGIVRPLYESFLGFVYPGGFAKIINGTDTVRLDPRLHGFPDEYEPEVWHHFMGGLKAGDTVVDVGALYGLYSLAAATRVGSTGRVIAFEPNAESREMLARHVRLNRVEDRVTLFPFVVTTYDGAAPFTLRGSQSTMLSVSDDAEGSIGVQQLPCARLDSVLAETRVDILKIDVEGFEELVLQGARGLLADARLRPRAIYIEIHAYAWGTSGTTGRSLLDFLDRYHFDVTFLDGRRAENLDDYYGEIVATRR